MTLTYAPPGWAPWGGNEPTCDCGNDMTIEDDMCQESEEREAEYDELIKEQRESCDCRACRNDEVWTQ